MKTMTNLTMAAAVALMTLPLGAQEKAAPDLVKMMPAGSGWVISCEWTRVLTEPVTMKIVEEIFKRPEIHEQLEGFGQMTGLDPRKNITRFCLSGPQVGQEGLDVIAVEGTFDTEYIKGVLGQFLPQGPAPYRTHGIYQVPDEKGGPANYLSIPNKSMLLFGREEAVKEALDVLDGTSKAAAGALVADLQKIDPAALVRLGVRELDKIKGDPNPIQPHLKNLIGGVLAVKDGVTVTAKAICDTADAAKEIGRICDGLLAFARLQADHERKPDVKILLKLVSPTTVVQNGTEISASLNVAKTTLEQIYARVINKKGEPRGGNAEQDPNSQ